MTLRALLTSGEKMLQAAGVEDWKIDAWYLLEEVCRIDRTRYLLDSEREVLSEEQEQYEALIQKRAAHIPLQHLTGHQEFMGLDFLVNEHVLVPRQDTEVLVEEVLNVLCPGSSILDLCTGSGCILLSILKLAEQRHMGQELYGTGADLSSEALQVAEKNRERLGVKAEFRQSDLFSCLNDSYDLIVSNPPYIASDVIEGLSEEVRDHEPRMALDGGKDGLDFYRIIIEESPAHLHPGGMLFFEIGHDQGAAVSGLMEKDFREIHVVKDLAGLDRVVCGKKA